MHTPPLVTAKFKSYYSCICEIRNVPTAVDRTVSSTKILGFFTREIPIIDLHGISVTAPYPNDQVHAVFDAGYFTLAPPTEVVPRVQQYPLRDLDSMKSTAVSIDETSRADSGNTR